MNPSFLPPVPMSDSQRSEIYRDHMAKPKKNSVRALSQKHGVSMKRIDAILRLKGMEEDWQKVSSFAFEKLVSFRTAQNDAQHD